MSLLISKLMVKAMLTKASALAPTKVQTRETRGKESFFNQAKAEGFELRDTGTKQRKVSNKRLSAEDLEEICGMLDEKREELDKTITEKIES